MNDELNSLKKLAPKIHIHENNNVVDIMIDEFLEDTDIRRIKIIEPVSDKIQSRIVNIGYKGGNPSKELF